MLTLERYLLDLGERVATAFAAAVVAIWAAAGLDLWTTVTGMSALQKLGVAGLVAAATLVMGLVAWLAGGTDTVSVFRQLSIDETTARAVDDPIKRAIDTIERELHEMHPADRLEARHVDTIAEKVHEIDHLLVGR